MEGQAKSLLGSVVIAIGGVAVLLTIALGVQRYLNPKFTESESVNQSTNVSIAVEPKFQQITSLSDMAIFNVTVENRASINKSVELYVAALDLKNSLDTCGIGEFRFADESLELPVSSTTKTTLTIVPGRQYHQGGSCDLAVVARDTSHPIRYARDSFRLDLNVIMETIGQQITDDRDTDNLDPDIFRSLIAWQKGGLHDTEKDIYFYDLSDANPIPIKLTNSPWDQVQPAIGTLLSLGNWENQIQSTLNDYLIVYADNRNPRNPEAKLFNPLFEDSSLNRALPWTLYIQSPGGGDGSILCNKETNRYCRSNTWQGSPAISGDKIVWKDGGANNNNKAIYLRSQGGETRLSKSLVGVEYTSVSAPDIDNDKVVWSSGDGNSDNINSWYEGDTKIVPEQVYFVDLSPESNKPVPFVLHPDKNSQQSSPKISGSKIVWQNVTRGSRNVEICLYDLDHPEKGVQMTNSRRPLLGHSHKVNVDISGDYVVWEDNYGSNTFPADLFIYDLANSKEYQLNDPSERMGAGNLFISYNNPTIDGKIIVCEKRRGHSQIYKFELQ